ncbi:protein YgfX [Motilimonas pumila]|uniref:Uncharacterized protein n=1 Tax=Motilimonas pumila TaxID=2303987 RepID=A0A418Y9N3_9GAMM|nr:protein YgfX [Motilimonas pumila]RJG37964.1 hypothetical protein D1Z90_19435 [Motilimonas pumila]
MLSSTALKYNSAVSSSRFACWLAAIPFFLFAFLSLISWQVSGFILCGAFISAAFYVKCRIQTSEFHIHFSEAGNIYLSYQNGQEFIGKLVPGCKMLPFVLCLKFASEDGFYQGRELIFFDAIRPSCFRRLARVINLAKLN